VENSGVQKEEYETADEEEVEVGLNPGLPLKEDTA